MDFFKLKKSYKKNDNMVNPNMYWTIVLSTFFILIIISFAYGFSTFMKINNDIVLPTVNKNDQIEKNRKERINNVLNYFSEKEQKTNDILNSPAVVVDPSI